MYVRWLFELWVGSAGVTQAVRGRSAVFESARPSHVMCGYLSSAGVRLRVAELLPVRGL